jgi:mono/diheme cytochrome c family protein
MAVVSRAGMTPDRSILLLGSRTYFERLFTRARLAVEKQQPGLRDATSDLTPFVSSGLVSQQVADGADLFFRGTFSGNGRTCATCHRVNDNLTLDPPFIDTLPGNDPLFIAELPASLGGVPGLEIPQLQRTFALILENVDGFQNPGVMRGVPHALSLATSIKAPNDGRAPVQRTGWSGDGAPGNGALINFATGAVIQHFTKSLNRVSGTDFVLPTTTQLEQINAFLLATGRLNEIDLANATLTDSGAQAGRGLFLSVGCNNCHKDAGSNIAGGTNNNFNTGIETVPHPGRAIDSVDFPADGGFGTTPNPKGGLGDGTFNVPPLIEAASTPPFFHNNVFNTIEQAVAFYTGPNFAAAPDGFPIALDGAQIFQVAAFLRVINASFSSAISLQRVNAALSLENSSSATFGTASALQTVNALLNLALATDDAAVNVLSTRLLNQGSVNEIDTASTDVQNAIASTDHTTRVSLMQDAITNLTNARTGLGTGLNFTLGEGNLLQ